MCEREREREKGGGTGDIEGMRIEIKGKWLISRGETEIKNRGLLCVDDKGYHRHARSYTLIHGGFQGHLYEAVF